MPQHDSTPLLKGSDSQSSHGTFRPATQTTSRNQETHGCKSCGAMICSCLAVVGFATFITYYALKQQHSNPNGPYESLLGIINNSSYPFKLTAVNFDSANCVDQEKKPNNCSCALPPEVVQLVGLKSTTSWGDLEYNVFDGEKYLGHFGIKFTPDAVTVSDQSGQIEVKLGPYHAGKPQTISITPHSAAQSANVSFTQTFVNCTAVLTAGAASTSGFFALPSNVVKENAANQINPFTYDKNVWLLGLLLSGSALVLGFWLLNKIINKINTAKPQNNNAPICMA